MARFEADFGDRVHLSVATTCAPIRCPSGSWALDTDKRSEPTEVFLLDPFVFGSAQMVGSSGINVRTVLPLSSETLAVPSTAADGIAKGVVRDERYRSFPA